MFMKVRAKCQVRKELPVQDPRLSLLLNCCWLTIVCCCEARQELRPLNCPPLILDRKCSRLRAMWVVEYCNRIIITASTPSAGASYLHYLAPSHCHLISNNCRTTTMLRLDGAAATMGNDDNCSAVLYHRASVRLGYASLRCNCLITCHDVPC
jgi:hypothetical protein